ncbi:MAG: HPr family phosphocarrier protein [Gammaproteobacteria bacterium]|jgi:phosphocarrier protein|nr:HPr family phosphocarrier protein [Gammaproteobacteria bacterium]MDG2339270.1 HPr family phosphocarrier protein [Gammaproteobacteria bacterium]
MLKATTTIINKAGLHARAAAKLVELTGGLESAVQIGHDKMVDGKSILSLMMLAAVQGTEISIEVDGADEERALSAILELIANRFDEAE